VRREVAETRGAWFIPADSIGISGEQNYCQGDPIHFNRAGSEAMASRLAERMLSIPALAR
jgi:hypothetical protein